jgi:hypothetical protein
MPAPVCHSKTLLEHDGPIETFRGPEVDSSYVDYAYIHDTYERGDYHAVHGLPAPVAQVKVEKKIPSVSYTPPYDSDYAKSDREDRRPSKIPKINKDGVPRKPRQPRPKLLKWSDNDWKNVVLGIVWACGETGVQIPFDQAAQVVGDSCTAGALQQAILKLRGKQIDEGYQIPSLRMAWTRKNKRASSSSSSSANANPKQVVGQDPLTPSRPSLVVKLKVPVSKPVAFKYVPEFNKAAAEVVRDDCKDKIHALNQAQDLKSPMDNAGVIGIQFNGLEVNGGLIGTHVDGFPVHFGPANGNVSDGTQGIGVATGPLSHSDRFAGQSRDIVQQAVPTHYHLSSEMSYDFEEDFNNNVAEDFNDNVVEDFNDSMEYGFVDNDEEELLAGPSSSNADVPSGSFPEMSSPLGHAYENPYSFLQGVGSPRVHSILPSAPEEQGLSSSLPLCAGEEAQRLDAGHFPDLFPHDVFSDCGFAQGSFVDAFKTEAPEDDYGFNAGHFN